MLKIPASGSKITIQTGKLHVPDNPIIPLDDATQVKCSEFADAIIRNIQT